MPRKQYTFHFIYKITNVLNKKYYFGMHSTDNLDDGYLGSGKRLWYSIKKYGKENFKFEILEFLPDRTSLKQREKEIVNEDLLKDSLCMNLKCGGDGGATFDGKKHSKKTRELISKIKKERGSNNGENNSQFGTIWITNGVDNKKIKKETSIPENWYVGRINVFKDITYKNQEQIIKLHNEGLNGSKISIRLSMNRGSVNRIIKKLLMSDEIGRHDAPSRRC